MTQDVVADPDKRIRCAWASTDELMAHYHDYEWGVPPESDNGYFEVLTLEVFQSGLSWRTILHRREGFRRAFAGFSIPVIANFTEHEVEVLLQDESIIRHRGKIEATIVNARSIQAVQEEIGSIRNWIDQMPPDPTRVYQTMKPHLRFFGPTTCLSFLQSIGKVPPPHEPECWKYTSDNDTR